MVAPCEVRILHPLAPQKRPAFVPRMTPAEALPHLLIRVESWHKWRRLGPFGIFKWMEWLFEDAGVDF